MIVLMLRLGLRAGEVAGLRLEDIDWRNAVVHVRGKRGRLDALPLPVDAGGRLAAYLRQARPRSTRHREVFLGCDAPHAVVSWAAVSSMTARAMRSAGITGAGRGTPIAPYRSLPGPRRGRRLVEAGQLLRHTDLTSTAIYARCDVAMLAVLARPWPSESAAAAGTTAATVTL